MGKVIYEHSSYTPTIWTLFIYTYHMNTLDIHLPYEHSSYTPLTYEHHWYTSLPLTYGEGWTKWSQSAVEILIPVSGVDKRSSDFENADMGRKTKNFWNVYWGEASPLIK